MAKRAEEKERRQQERIAREQRELQAAHGQNRVLVDLPLRVQKAQAAAFALEGELKEIRAEVERLRTENQGLRETLNDAVEFVMSIDGKADDFGRLVFIARAQDVFGIAR